MQDKLQLLTEKLYNEGLSKGQKEADDLIAKAKDEAKQMLDNARKEAQDILTSANKQASESKANADTEIKIASKQVITTIKQEIENMIITKSVSPANKAAFDDIPFIKELIKTAIGKFNPSNVENFQLSVILPEDKQADFESFMKDKTTDLMKAEIEVNLDKRFKSGFKIAPKGEGYYISFTEQDFDNLFREYLRPKMANLLFEDKQ